MREYIEVMQEAISLFDGDIGKANKFLNIITKLQFMQQESSNAYIKHRCEALCTYYSKGECWKDAPDSMRACTTPCKFYEPIKYLDHN